MDSDLLNNNRVEENNDRKIPEDQNNKSQEISTEETANTTCGNSSDNSFLSKPVTKVPNCKKSSYELEIENIFKDKIRESNVNSTKASKQGLVFEISTWSQLKNLLDNNSTIFNQALYADKIILDKKIKVEENHEKNKKKKKLDKQKSDEEKIKYKTLYRSFFASQMIELLESKIASILLNFVKKIKKSWEDISNSEYPDKVNQEEYVQTMYPNVAGLNDIIEQINSSIENYTPLTKEFKDQVLSILDLFNKEESPLEKYFKQKFNELHILDNYKTKVSCARSPITLEAIQSCLSIEFYNLLMEDKFFRMSYNLLEFEVDGLFIVLSKEEQNETSNQMVELNPKRSFNFKYKTPCK